MLGPFSCKKDSKRDAFVVNIAMPRAQTLALDEYSGSQ